MHQKTNFNMALLFYHTEKRIETFFPKYLLKVKKRQKYSFQFKILLDAPLMVIWKSRHQHWNWHQHRRSSTNVVFTQYKSPLEIKVLYIFVKHVIVNKVATYRSGTCHFVRKCF